MVSEDLDSSVRDEGLAHLVPASEVDFTKLHSLLTHAFSNTDGRGPEIPNVQRLADKYRTPRGTSYVAICEMNGEYVAANGALHTPLKGPYGASDAWMSCDTATRTSHRGRGLFLACINAIRSALPNQPIFFGFPNTSSLRGFEKTGWETKLVLPIWAAWVGIGKKEAKQSSIFLESPSHLTDERTVSIDKSESYLNWRYPLDAPLYSRLSGTTANEEYLIITRQILLSGFLTTLILEHIYVTPAGFAQGLRAVRQFARHQGSSLLAFSPQPNELGQLMRRGFVKLPHRVNPRPIRLMGQGLGQSSRNLWECSWRASLGDWDAL